MALHRGIDGPDPGGAQPIRPPAGPHEQREDARSWRLAAGTLACPACDAPVAPGPVPLSPADALSCPLCRQAGAVRDFLSLEAPSRPARVAVRVVPSERRGEGEARRAARA